MNRQRLYVKITEDDLKILDKIAETLNYQTRTDFTTAIILTVIYSDNAEHALKNIRSTADTKNQAKEEFFAILNEYAFSIIAMRGVEFTYKNLKNDIQTWMYERCRYVPTEQEIHNWIHEYAAIKNSDIKNYQNSIMLSHYEEEHEINETEANP